VDSDRIDVNFQKVRLILSCFMVLTAASAQDAVTIRVHAAEKIRPFKPIYSYFGYDEPNFTYAKNGRKLVGELAALSSSPVFIRTHFMLATGDGIAGFKFGSTNAYTEDASGKPVYDWTIVDRIIDTYLDAGAKPFIEIGFMPKALSTNPETYRPDWSPGSNFSQYYLGWAYPPKDYAKWAELVYQWVRHEVDQHGRSEVESWYWEVWNEPDIAYWHGTPEEYDKLYDYTAQAVKRALPAAQIGGPASTGPSNAKAAAFLRQFLEHCANKNTPLDFITYHAKGRPSVVDGHVRMGISKNAEDVDKGFEIVRAFPKFQNLPIVLSESDPEGCAACSARVYPQNAYRNGPLYSAYEAVMMKNIFDLAGRAKTNIAGMLTWAFEFEDQPYFDGFRTLATNGIDKPVLNFFRMAGMMRGDRVRTESTSAVSVKTMIADGVRGNADVDALAVRSDREVSVLAWNYHDDDVAAPVATLRITITGLPTGRILLRHYRIDETHSNAWTVWKKMGSPQHPSEEEYAALETAGQLQEIDSPRWIVVKASEATIDISMPRQAVSLLNLLF
jgi:xylan 1,4-beta-xylosidase